jgi:hypothetical protein
MTSRSVGVDQFGGGAMVARTTSSASAAATAVSSTTPGRAVECGSGAGSKWQCTAHSVHSSMTVRAITGAGPGSLVQRLLRRGDR